MSGLPISVLFKNDQLRVVHQPGDSDWLLITFNPRGVIRQETGFWGQEVAAKLRLNTLSFVTTNDNWYPTADMLAAVAAAQPVLDQFGEKVTYGASMGGYAALKHGPLVGATTAISFNPQASINPADLANGDTRYARYFRPALHAGMCIGPGEAPANSLMLYDPFFPLDVWQADMIVAANPWVKRIACHLLGHRTVIPFAGTAIVEQLFTLCRQGDQAAVQRFAMQQRKRHWSRAQAGITEATRRHAAWGEALFRNHADRLPKPDWVQMQFDRANMLARPQPALAEPILLSVLERQPQHAGSLRLLSALLSRRGAVAEARALAEQWVSHAPESAPAHYQLIDLLLKEQRPQAAVLIAEKALQLAPDSAETRFRLAEAQLAAGQVDAARENYRLACLAAPADARVSRMKATLGA